MYVNYKYKKFLAWNKRFIVIAHWEFITNFEELVHFLKMDILFS